MNWTPIIVALIGSFAAWLAFFLSPASERLAFKQKDRDEIISRLVRIETEVAELRTSNRFLTAGVTALQWHSDELRRSMMKTDSSIVIRTAAEILLEVRSNIDALDRESEPHG